MSLVEGGADTRSFVWGSSYTSAKFYSFLFEAVPCDKVLQAIWTSKCLPKLRVFAWLLFTDRLNTKDIMNRKQWVVQGGPSCVLCNTNSLETTEHLFFQCPFAYQCWNQIGVTWDLSLNLSDRYFKAKDLFNNQCFMEIIICSAWNLWKERNDYIFESKVPSAARWRVRFKSDLSLHQYRVKASLVQPLPDWIISF
jgi:hypothetical protein